MGGVKRSSLVISLIAGLALIVVGFLLLWPTVSLPKATLRGLPSDVHGFVRVRVGRVLASKLWRQVVVERGEARGIERVTKQCGFNPLAGLDQLVVAALPREQKKGAKGKLSADVVVSAQGKLEHTRLIDCVIRYGGGSLSSFEHERVAGFDTVRSKKGTARAGFVGRDGLIAGDVAAVDKTLRVLAAQAPSADKNATLHELYTTLKDDSDIAVAARMPTDPAQLARLTNSLQVPEGVSLATVRGFTANAQLIDDRIRGEARFWLLDGEAAKVLADNLNRLRGKILALPGIGLMGFATPVRNARVEVDGKIVKLSGELKASTINAAIDVLPALAALQEGFDASGTSSAASEDAGAALSDAGTP